MTWNNGTLIIIALIGFVGTWLTQRNAHKAQQYAAQAKIDAARAQRDAADAARQLVIAARSTDARLENLKTIATGTHMLVNNQRTVMLRMVASLASRVASDNPNDKQAQAAAEQANREATEAEGAATA